MVLVILLLTAVGVLVGCAAWYGFYARRSHQIVHGEIALKEQRRFDTQDLHYLPDELPFRIYHAHFLGSWVQTPSIAPPPQVKVAHLHMNEVDQVFLGQRLHWCTVHDVAQRMLGESESARRVRERIGEAHNRQLNQREGRQRGIVRSLDDLRCLLAGCSVNSDKPAPTVHYTYVLMDNGELRFSCGITAPLIDNLSRHALLANCAEYVVYAGEFSFDFSEDVLTLNNSSGTYTPQGTTLALIAELFGRNFPQLEVRTNVADYVELSVMQKASPESVAAQTPIVLPKSMGSANELLLSVNGTDKVVNKIATFAPSVSSTSGLSSSSVAPSGCHPLKERHGVTILPVPHPYGDMTTGSFEGGAMPLLA